jgi:hypothetical protein
VRRNYADPSGATNLRLVIGCGSEPGAELSLEMALDLWRSFIAAQPEVK